MNDQDRIQLAEAMGWTRERTKHGEWFWTDPQRHVIAIPYDETGCPSRPDEHADDDYAVLEWMRDHIFSKRTAFAKALGHELQKIEEDGSLNVAWPDAAMRYQIGDYARAALTVLQLQEPK